MPSASVFLVISALMMMMMITRICSGGPTIEELKLVVSNPANGTEGGRRFDREIGRDVALEILRNGTQFIWKVFRQESPDQRKNVQQIRLLVESIGGVAYTANDEIHLSAEYVGNYSGDVKREIKGVLYHELTRIWLPDGIPSPLANIIGDYVRLRANLVPSYWVKPGSGNTCNKTNGVAAYFFRYCKYLNLVPIDKVISQLSKNPMSKPLTIFIAFLTKVPKIVCDVGESHYAPPPPPVICEVNKTNYAPPPAPVSSALPVNAAVIVLVIVIINNY